MNSSLAPDEWLVVDHRVGPGGEFALIKRVEAPEQFDFVRKFLGRQISALAKNAILTGEISLEVVQRVLQSEVPVHSKKEKQE
jgi:hypothetical protein